MSLTNIELEDIARALKLPLIGVFSKDQLPSKRCVGSYIINMQDSNDGSGTHWVYCRIFDCCYAVYYDSFGVYMPKEIEDFLKPFKPIPFSKRQIQNMKSQNCGRYCILIDDYFNNHLKSKKRETDNEILNIFNDFLSTWSDDTIKNERLCIERWNKL